MRREVVWFVTLGFLVFVSSLVVVTYLLAQVPYAWQDGLVVQP
jgi:hypothetical protein